MISASHQSLTAKNSDCSRDLLETCDEEFKLVVKNIEYPLNILELVQQHQAPLQVQQEESIAMHNAERQRGEDSFALLLASTHFFRSNFGSASNGIGHSKSD